MDRFRRYYLRHKEQLAQKRQTEEWKRYHHEWYLNHKQEHLKKCVDYAREHREQVNVNNRQYYQSHREEILRKTHEYRGSHKKECSARKKANQIQLEPACEFCGSTKNLERHHPDYLEPLIVLTTCKTCHSYLGIAGVETQDIFDSGNRSIERG